MHRGSVGTVKTAYLDLPVPLTLESGAVLSKVTIAYETYGKLNREKNNAILVCHALSGDAHAAGVHEGETRSGWWDTLIGPGKAFDTDKYCVICTNIIGGCKGSTGPSSINPETGKPYGLSFPVITIRDMVNAQKLFVDMLGIPQLLAVAGGSAGGMQALQWAVSYPEMVRKVIAIATTAYSTPMQIAFNEVGRKAITSDPKWNGGNYYHSKDYDSPGPVKGLALARMVGHITYLSDESMHAKFGRRLQDRETFGYDFSTEFRVESYLHHQGDTFTKRFDANSYLYITKAIDYFDLTVDGSLIKAFGNVKAQFLIISVTSDWLYPPYLSQEMVSALAANDAEVQYSEVRSHYGHDAFLLEAGQMNYIVGRFLSHMVVRDLMIPDVPAIREGVSIENAAKLLISEAVNHLPVVGEDGILAGIVTSWDISKAVACRHLTLEEIMSRKVVTAAPDEPIKVAVNRMEQHNISALPVVDGEGRVLGIITSEAISTLIERCR
jgi:homoserine O-acetyltransferase